MDAEYSTSQLSFFAAVLVCGLLVVRVIIPPNQTPADRAWRNDSLWFASSKGFINLAIAAVTALVLYHAALVVSPPATLRRICPVESAPGAASQRNPELFAWSPVTAVSFLVILLGAPLRMGAFNNLGRNFTFGLAKPNRLVTDGIYKWMQHPSYTGMAVVAMASFATFTRLDGPVACIIPPEYWQPLSAWNTTIHAGAALFVVHQITTRVMQEEAMLKEVFGKEWEQWHAETKRFIPGLF